MDKFIFDVRISIVKLKEDFKSSFIALLYYLKMAIVEYRIF